MIGFARTCKLIRDKINRFRSYKKYQNTELYIIASVLNFKMYTVSVKSSYPFYSFDKSHNQLLTKVIDFHLSIQDL